MYLYAFIFYFSFLRDWSVRPEMMKYYQSTASVTSAMGLSTRFFPLSCQTHSCSRVSVTCSYTFDLSDPRHKSIILPEAAKYLFVTIYIHYPRTLLNSKYRKMFFRKGGSGEDKKRKKKKSSKKFGLFFGRILCYTESKSA